MDTTFNEPLVSVVIPTYNRPEYLKQAIASAVKQTYQNIEIMRSPAQLNRLIKILKLLFVIIVVSKIPSLLSNLLMIHVSDFGDNHKI